MYRIVEGDSDLELSDEEKDKNEFAPAEEDRESSEEEAGGSSDELTDTDEQENRRPLWAKTSTYDRSIDKIDEIRYCVHYLID